VETWNKAKDYEYFSTAETYTYYHCTGCGTIFIDPVPVEQLRQIYPWRWELAQIRQSLKLTLI
jgi:hypothetical protein